MQSIFQKENADKALKYRLYRHLPAYEKIIRNLVSFYYEKDRVTILDYEFLTSVHKKEQAYVMYADSCALSDSDLQKWNITFKKIPRDIEHI